MSDLNEFSWIKNEVGRLFPETDFYVGVDLDQNGAIEPWEEIRDENGNGEIGDKDDWEFFYYRNQDFLEHFGGGFYWTGTFHPDNVIHDVFSIERELLEPETIEKAYQKSAQILEESKDPQSESTKESTKLILKELDDLPNLKDYGFDVYVKLSGIITSMKTSEEEAPILLSAGLVMGKLSDANVRAVKKIFRDTYWFSAGGTIRTNFPISDAYSRRGRAYQAQNNLEKAIADFRKAFDISGFPEHEMALAEALVATGEKESIDEATGLLSFLPGMAESESVTFYEKGTYLTGKIALTQGEKTFRAILLEAKDKEGLKILLKVLNEAIEKNPGNALNYKLRAEMHDKLGDLRSAAADYEKALALGETDPKISFYLCKHYLLTETEKSKKYCDTGSEKPYELLTIATRQFQSEDFDGSIKTWGRYIELNQDNPGDIAYGLFMRMSVRTEVKDYKGVLEDAEKLYPLAKQNSAMDRAFQRDISYYVAQALFHTNRQEEALKKMDTYMKNKKPDAAELLLRGAIYSTLGRYRDAVNDMEAALSQPRLSPELESQIRTHLPKAIRLMLQNQEK